MHRIGAVCSFGAMGVAVGAATGAGVRVDQAGEQRLARIESLRALAALGVLAGHAWGAHYAFGRGAMRSLPARTIFGGGFGVFVFFALSGYLLYRPLVDGDVRRRRVDLRRYAINRVLRTLPLYYAVVTSCSSCRRAAGRPASGCASRRSPRTSSARPRSPSTARSGR